MAALITSAMLKLKSLVKTKTETASLDPSPPGKKVKTAINVVKATIVTEKAMLMDIPIERKLTQNIRPSTNQTRAE